MSEEGEWSWRAFWRHVGRRSVLVVGAAAFVLGWAYPDADPVTYAVLVIAFLALFAATRSAGVGDERLERIEAHLARIADAVAPEIQPTERAERPAGLSPVREQPEHVALARQEVDAPDHGRAP